MLSEKLDWSDPPKSYSLVPYSDPRNHSSALPVIVGDYRIRLNDYPYAVTKDVTHLVVWSTVQFPSDTSFEERNRTYDDFVKRNMSAVPKENRAWFVNWRALKSIPGIEVWSFETSF